MRAVNNIFRWLVFSNVFIALCAVLMCWQAAYLFRLTLPPALLPFVFFASICSYSFHWYLSFDITGNSPRAIWLRQYKPVHLILFVGGLTGAAFFVWPLLFGWPWLLLSMFITFLYSAPKIPLPVFRQLRRIAYGKTIFLAMVWTYVTTALPFILASSSWQPGFTLLCVSRFFLIYAICILFDYRDREYDRVIGIKSLITWMSDAHIARLFIASIAIFFVCTLLLQAQLHSFSAIFLLLVPGLLTAASYRRATRDFSDMYYYAWLDGLMAISAFLTWLLHLINS